MASFNTWYLYQGQYIYVIDIAVKSTYSSEDVYFSLIYNDPLDPISRIYGRYAYVHPKNWAPSCIIERVPVLDSEKQQQYISELFEEVKV
jgi:hypothetical protein